MNMGGVLASKQLESPPVKFSRKDCWEAKDAYFACLDRYEAKEQFVPRTTCEEERHKFEDQCLPSWQAHFLAQRGVLPSSSR